MTVYNASKMAAGVQPRILQTGAGVVVLSTIALPNNLALNDTINWMKLESDPSIPVSFGPTILGVSMDSDKLDSNVAPAITLDLGDATTAARYVSQATIAQNGGYIGANVGGWLGYQPFAAAFTNYPTTSQQTYTLVGKVHAAAATPQAGTLRVKAEYTYDP